MKLEPDLEPKPEPRLKPSTGVPGRFRWARAHPAGLIAFAIGLAALAITAAVHLGSGDEFTKIPDSRLTIPLLVMTVIAGVTTFVRREGAYALPIAGIALAVAATILGWALIIGTVAAVAALIILILSEFM